MTVEYAVTFEFAIRPPMTHRGTVAGSKVATCVARAVRTAQTALRPQGWTSVVCVLLERVQQTPGFDSDDDPDAPKALP